MFKYKKKHSEENRRRAGNENDNLKILNENNPEIQSARLFLIKKIQLVIKTGLDILNVTAPVEM